jgi:ferredoxin--NADP+ reductase
VNAFVQGGRCVRRAPALPTLDPVVRAGVAPDHPNIKSVTRAFEKTARHERVRFLGGVELGTHLQRADLVEHYHVVIYAIGTPTDRRIGIPGENLSRTDAAGHAIEVLGRTQVEEIRIVGRRGPAQAAFTNPELLEIGELQHCDVGVDPPQLELDAGTTEWLAGADAHRTNRVNVEILHEFARRPRAGRPKEVHFTFLASPVEILGDSDARVRAVRLEHNELVNGRSTGTGRCFELDCQLVFRSIGYRGTPVPDIPFDGDRDVIRNDSGRVCDESGVARVGEYVTGWVKRGPSGVIGTNKKDSKDTVDRVLEDARAERLRKPQRRDIRSLLEVTAPEHVTWAGWEAIDAAEVAAGAERGRPRVKLVRWEDLHRAGRAGMRDVPDLRSGVARGAPA